MTNDSAPVDRNRQIGDAMIRGGCALMALTGLGFFGLLFVIFVLALFR